jgi:hypothetical protein
MIALFATLLLAAPASAARFQHTGPDIDFTVAPTDVVKLTVTGHKLGDPRQMTFTRGTGATPFSIGSGCSLFINTGIASCFVGDTARLRLTTNDLADTIDASRTATTAARRSRSCSSATCPPAAARSCAARARAAAVSPSGPASEARAAS